MFSLRNRDALDYLLKRGLKKNIIEEFFNSHCDMAIEIYTGVVYEYIDWNSLNDTAKKYMEKHVRIFSGLFGILTPETLIPNYKLKMNVLSLQFHLVMV